MIKLKMNQIFFQIQTTEKENLVSSITLIIVGATQVTARDTKGRVSRHHSS